MSNINSLKEELAGVANEIKTLSESVETEKRNFTQDECQRFDALETRETELKQQIDTAERIQRAKGINAPAVIHFHGSNRPITRNDHNNGLRAWLLKQSGPANSYRIRPEWQDAAERCGYILDSDQLVTRVQAGQTLTDAEGGYLQNDGVVQGIVTTLKSFGGVRKVAQVLNTATGAPLPFATNDDTANAAAIVGENVADTATYMTFGTISLGAYTYRTSVFPISLELVQDSAIDLVSYVSNAIGTRLARGTNADFTTGAGTSGPKGVKAASTKVADTASATAITYAELLDLYYGVDVAYRESPNCAWMMHDSTLAYLDENLKNGTTGEPFWQTYADLPQMKLKGKPIIINNQMEEIAASKVAVIFGDFSRFLIRDVVPPTIVVLRERYADNHALGIVGFHRCDSDLLDAAALKNLTQKSS